MTLPARLPLPPAEHQGSIHENQGASGRRYFAIPEGPARFAQNAGRLRLHAPASNFANFLRALPLPGSANRWSMTTLRDRLVEIYTKVVRHGRSITFQMAEVMVPRGLFQQTLDAIAALRPLPLVRC